MNRNRYSRRITALLITAMFIGVNSLMAASGTWNGSSDSFWTNSTNWSESSYAGSAAGETATFTNSTGATSLDLTGLGSIFDVIFDTTAAAYTLGSGSDTLVLEDGGEITITDAAVNSQSIGAEIQLGPDSVNANYSLSNYKADQTLSINNISGSSGGTKSLNFYGSGNISVAGDINQGSSAINIYSSHTGSISLEGTNNIRTLTLNGADGVINITDGNTIVSNGGSYNLVASQNCTINGPGKITLGTGGGINYGDNGVANGKTLTINAPISGVSDAGFEYWHNTYRGTIALLGANDYTGITVMNQPATIMVTNINNNATVGNLGAGNAFRHNGAGSRLLYTGPGQDTARTIELYQSGIIEQGGTGNLNFTSDIVVSGTGRTLTLQGGTDGTGQWSGLLQNSAGSLNIAKAGSGGWTLTANNTYSGSTTVNEGTLEISGINGDIASSANNTVASGGVLKLSNTATANNGNRMHDTGTITMTGGTLDFDNDASAASFAETIGAVNIASSASTIHSDQAAVGQTSTLTISSISSEEGTVDFTGTGLGADARNKIMITDQPDGVIGLWATVDGTNIAAYSSTSGVYPISALTTNEIAARGPASQIPDNGLGLTHITTPGTSGSITMAGAWTNQTFQLLQNIDQSATVQTRVGTTNKTLQTANLNIAASMHALTIGEVAGDGYLSSIYPGSDLLIENLSTSNLTVNASVVDNSSPSSLTKKGAGAVLLNGANTYSGPTTVKEGTLIVDGSSVTPLGGQTLESPIIIYNGEMVLTDTDDYVTNQNCYVGYNSGDSGKLTLRGNSSLKGHVPASSTGTQALRVGEYGNGILVIEENAVITNKLMAGVNSSSAGAVYQSGGTFNNIGAQGNDGRIGYYGYGYYELSGGYYKQWGFCQAGIEPAAVGIIHLEGGTFESGNSPSGYSGNFGLSRGGSGILRQSGGLFTTPEVLEIGDEYDNSRTDGYAEYTIEGGEAEIRNNIFMARRNNMFATLNLNGGLVSANRIYRESGRTGNEAYVNFDGGTYQERNGGDVIDDGAEAPDAVNLFEGGAVIDTQGYACNMPVPLLAPSGQGVSTISVTPTSGYIGAPLVRVTGGGGAGATALADFDSASGMVTGITVTSPGFGYTSNPTVTLSGGGTSSQAPVTGVTLSANISGGLTKIGEGWLTMTATNTYTGTTVISNGTFALGVANALPADADISIDGGTYNLGNFSETNGTVSVTSGSIANGALTSDSLTKNDSGELLLSATLSTTDPIVINAGSLKLVGKEPGLYEGFIDTQFDLTTPNPATEVELSMVMADTVYYEPYNSTFVYSGYIWNQSTTNETWTFLENFDDQVQLMIDGNQVLYDTSWSTATKANYTLTPGPHAIEGRFGQGTGGGGPPSDGNTAWFKTGQTIGFAVDFLGRNEEVVGNYEALIDPGDGTLFTLTPSKIDENLIAENSTVEMADGTLLDLGETSQSLDTLSGSGTVSNGTLIITGTLAPGGIDTLGTLTLYASLDLTGELLIDVATDGSSDLLAVDGDLDLTSATLRVANPDDLNTTKSYTIATATGIITDPFDVIDIDDSKWQVKVKPGGLVKLIYQSGAVLIIR